MTWHTFWMICRAPKHAGSITAPTHRYSSRREAELAAQMLADQTGHPFVILTGFQTIWPTQAGESLFNTQQKDASDGQ